MNAAAQQKIDKIQILLVDDDPNALPQHTDWPQKTGGPPQMDVDYKQWFEFRWVATPQEACEYRDLSWQIAQRDPTCLTSEGWLPEILVLDYSLTQDNRTVASRVFDDKAWLDRLSPLPSLRQCYERLFPGDTIGTARETCPISPAGSEYWGCFIGGLLITTFADHPCAPVTITRYSKQTIHETAIDVEFFEWAMNHQSGGLLQAEGCTANPSWDDILQAGLKPFRDRLRALAKARIVFPSIDDLQELAKNANHPVLAMTSRYGCRRYPVVGMFIDKQDDPSAWAKEVLEDILPNVEEFLAGLEMAKRLWAGYKNIGCQEKRWRLSELLLKDRNSSLDATEASELTELKMHFGYKRTEKTRNQRPVVTEELTNPEYVADLRMGRLSVPSRRWGALLVLQRLRASIDRANTFVKGEAQRHLPDVSIHHAYHALFPLPSSPALLPWHDPEKDAKSSWGARLEAYGVDLDNIDGCTADWEADVLRSQAVRFL